MDLDWCTIDLDAHVARRPDGSAVALTAIEGKLLRYLGERRGRTVPEQQLLVDVWGYAAKVRSRTVKVTVSRLRDKIERDPRHPTNLVNVFGVGYRLEALDDPGFTGRSADEGALADLVGAHTRVVTITGPGGIGKTRLARRLVERDPRTPFVDLSSARGLGDVAGLLAAWAELPLPGHLEVDAQLDRSLLRLSGSGAAAGVVVLDNLEQLGEAAGALVARWDRLAAPGVTLVTTSRSPTGAPVERVLPLGPLGVEAGRRLFLAHARRARPDGADATDPDRVDRIVAALDGLPLALELAAARRQVLSLAEIERGLADRVRLLRDPSRSGRHGSLGAVVGWSWEQLADPERAVLRQLLVFAGPVDVGGVETVVAAADPLASIGVLVRHSLVVREEVDGVTGWRLLATVRACGRDLHPTDAEDLRVRWLAWLAELQRHYEDRPDRETVFARYLPEWREALHHLRLGSPEVAARVAVGAATLFLSLGEAERAKVFLAAAEVWQDAVTPSVAARLHLLGAEALRRSGDRDRALRRYDDACGRWSEPAALAQALTGRAATLLELGRTDDSLQAAGLAMAQARRAGREDLEFAALVNHTNVLRLRGDPRAVHGYARAAEVAERVGFASVRVLALASWGGCFLEQLRPDLAAPLLARAVDAGRSGPGRRWLAMCLANLANSLKDLGRLAEAMDRGVEAVAEARASAEPRMLGYTHLILAQIALEHGDLDRATAEALAGREAVGEPRGVGMADAVLGWIAVERGAFAAALGHFDASLRSFESLPDDRFLVSVRALRASLLPLEEGLAALPAEPPDPETAAQVDLCRALIRLEVDPDGARAALRRARAPAPGHAAPTLEAWSGALRLVARRLERALGR